MFIKSQNLSQNSIYTTLNYSPNFDKKKRKPKEIKFIVFHYTGMKNELSVIKKFCDENSKVSSHYLIKKNGGIIKFVPDLYEAWHAGKSSWKKIKSINKYSIGIEIQNQGHDYKSDVVWQIFMRGDPWEIVRVYNYKDGKNYLGDKGLEPEQITRWCIGSNKRDKARSYIIDRLNVKIY